MLRLPIMHRFSRQSRATPPAETVAASVATRQRGEVVFDEALLTQLRRLTLISRGALADGLAGEHRSRRRGASPEFADFKPYSQGDDFRRIDWNTFARLDGLFVRLSEVTTEFEIHLLLDASNSMNWAGTRNVPTKFTYARRVAGALGYLGLWRFDRLTLAPFGTTMGETFGPVQGRSHAVPLLRFLERLPVSGGTDLPMILRRYVRARRRAGIMLIISDLLSGEPADFQVALRDLRARGWRTTVLHIVDPAELDPTITGGLAHQAGLAEFVDLEGNERLRLSPTDEVVRRYQHEFGDWLTATEAACSAELAEYIRLQTDWSLEDVVMRILHEREVIA